MTHSRVIKGFSKLLMEIEANNMKLSTFFVIAGMLIISMYFIIDVNYYAATSNISEDPKDTPYLNIPKIGVYESINNKSVSYGIYHEPKSYKPGHGTVILFGHRTLYGSPFLDLDKLKKDDRIFLEWPDIGNVEYKVTNSFVATSSYQIPVEKTKKLVLVTCYPLGSMEKRLIIEAKQVKIDPFQNTKTVNNNNKAQYAILLIGVFFMVGMVLSYVYPIDEDKIFIFSATIVLTLFLVFGFMFPIPPENVASQLSNMSGFLGL